MPDKLFRDPIHNFIPVSQGETRIIDTAAFQRLRRIRQLGFTYLVYHGAEHSRFGHSLGTMHIATRIYDHLVSENREAIMSVYENEGYFHRNRVMLRLFALLHDLGHGPFSHSSDAVLPRRDGEAPISHESIGIDIMTSELRDVINAIGEETERECGVGFTIEDLAHFMTHTSTDNKLSWLYPIVSSDIDVDKMDYLLRDSHYCGVKYGLFDLERLIQGFTVLRNTPDEAAIRIALKDGAVSTLEAFILARYYMFSNVYFHHTRRFFDLAYERLMQASQSNLPCDFYRWTDDQMWSFMESGLNASPWAQAILQRRPWRVVWESSRHPQSELEQTFDSIRNFVHDSDTLLVDTSAKKGVHSIPVWNPEAEDETAIPIITKNGQIQDIFERSLIISQFKSKLSIIRVYARDDKAGNSFKGFLQSLRDLKGGQSEL